MLQFIIFFTLFIRLMHFFLLKSKTYVIMLYVFIHNKFIMKKYNNVFTFIFMLCEPRERFFCNIK